MNKGMEGTPLRIKGWQGSLIQIRKRRGPSSNKGMEGPPPLNKVMEGPPLQIKKEKGSSLEHMNGRDPSFNTEREVAFLRMKG